MIDHRKASADRYPGRRAAGGGRMAHGARRALSAAATDEAPPRARLERIEIVTIGADNVAAFTAAYERWFDYRVAQTGRISAALAASWGAPATAGRAYALLHSRGAEDVWLRVVDVDVPAASKAMTTLGWSAVEFLVQNPDAVYAHLSPSPFRHIGGPANLGGGASSIRATQFIGPAAVAVYLSADTAPPHSALLPRAKSFIDRPFIVVHVLERSVSTVALFGLAQLAGKLLSIPLWLKLARVRGKAWILALSTLLFIPLAGSWLLAGAAEPLWVYIARGFFLGIATAGTLLGAQAMLPDIMEYDYLRSGMRREGMYAGLASFIEKTAYALAAVAVGGFLAARGFDKSLPSGEQPDTALFAISACISLIPMAAYGIKLLLLSFYRLDDRALRDARAAGVPRHATG